MRQILVALFALAQCASVAAYEVDTHAYISSKALDRSQLAQPALRGVLGLNRFGDEASGQRPFQIPSGTGYGANPNAYLDVEHAGWLGGFPAGTRRPPTEYDRFNMISEPGADYRNNFAEQFRLKAWLMRGAIREDDLLQEAYDGHVRPDADPYGEMMRVYHHFYDPVHHTPLSTEVPCSNLPGSDGDCIRSPDWAFGETNVTGANTTFNLARRNHFTWADATSALWCALTRNAGNFDTISFAARNAAERRLCWATNIVSLGHVLHLLQDTAQPQHVRNDRHNPADFPYPVSTTIARRTYEVWTNYRATGARLGGEISVGDAVEAEQFRSAFEDGTVLASPIAADQGYPIPRFSEPQYYFSTRQVEQGATPEALKKRRGLADLANRSFYSEGTFLSAEFPLPPSDINSPELSSKMLEIRTVPGFGTLIERNVTGGFVDLLKGAYDDVVLAPFDGRIPLGTISMWEDFQTNETSLQSGVLSLDQYSAHADVLIPRAIAYSAGLIDYFFRGKLEITPPLDGLFSVIDHGTPHSVNANGYPIRNDDNKIFGFTKLRLRVRNATDVVNESGTNLPIPRDMMSTTASAVPLQGDPTLVAVARYHRNPCYKPDLSGERRIAFDGVITEPTGCGTAGTRTPFQELSVSKPVASNAAALNGAGQDLVFDFGSQPIPVNATDLAIQVVYRGPLGLESDAIAVGAFDIREPTYLTHWNNTDYAACNGTWAAHGATPPGCIAEGVAANRAILTTRLCVGTQLVFEHLDNTHGSLGVDAFVRLVTLLDDKQKPTRSRSVVHDISNAEIRNRSIVGQVRQSTKEQPTAQAAFVSEPLWRKRGFVGSSRPLPYYQISGADLQPPSDAGPMDVGALTNPIAAAAAPDPGTVVFPDVAVSNMACTVAGGKAMFADEVAYEAGRSH